MQLIFVPKRHANAFQYIMHRPLEVSVDARAFRVRVRSQLAGMMSKQFSDITLQYSRRRGLRCNDFGVVFVARISRVLVSDNRLSVWGVPVGGIGFGCLMDFHRP